MPARDRRTLRTHTHTPFVRKTYANFRATSSTHRRRLGPTASQRARRDRCSTKDTSTERSCAPKTCNVRLRPLQPCRFSLPAGDREKVIGPLDPTISNAILAESKSLAHNTGFCDFGGDGGVSHLVDRCTEMTNTEERVWQRVGRSCWLALTPYSIILNSILGERIRRSSQSLHKREFYVAVRIRKEIWIPG